MQALSQGIWAERPPASEIDILAMLTEAVFRLRRALLGASLPFILTRFEVLTDHRWPVGSYAVFIALAMIFALCLGQYQPGE